MADAITFTQAQKRELVVKHIQQKKAIDAIYSIFVSPLMKNESRMQAITEINFSIIIYEIFRQTGGHICPTILLMTFLAIFRKGKQITNQPHVIQFYNNITSIVFDDINLSFSFSLKLVIDIIKIFPNFENLELQGNKLFLIDMGSFIQDLQNTTIRTFSYCVNNIYPDAMIETENDSNKLAAIITNLVFNLPCLVDLQITGTNGDQDFITQFCEIMNSRNSNAISASKIKNLTISNIDIDIDAFEVLIQHFYENRYLKVLLFHDWLFDSFNVDNNTCIINSIINLINANSAIQRFNLCVDEEDIDNEDDIFDVAPESIEELKSVLATNHALLDIVTIFPRLDEETVPYMHTNLHRFWMPINHTLFTGQFHKIVMTFLLLNFEREYSKLPQLSISLCFKIFGFFNRESQKTFEYFE